MGMNPITGNLVFHEDDIEVYRSPMPFQKGTEIVFKWRFNGERCARAFEVNSIAFDERNDWKDAYRLADKFSQMLVTYLSAIYRMDVESNPVVVSLIAFKIIECYRGEEK